MEPKTLTDNIDELLECKFNRFSLWSDKKIVEGIKALAIMSFLSGMLVGGVLVWILL